MNPAALTYWSKPAQARRVLQDAWQLLHWDMLRGVVYVVAGLAIFSPSTGAGYCYPGTSAFIAAFVMGYITLRLTMDDVLPETETYYFNLPRDWSVTKYTRLGVGLIYGVLLVAIIALAVRLNLGRDVPPLPQKYPLMLMAYPFIVSCLIAWTLLGTLFFFKMRAVLALTAFLVFNTVVMVTLIMGYFPLWDLGRVQWPLVMFQVIVIVFVVGFVSLMVFNLRKSSQR